MKKDFLVYGLILTVLFSIGTVGMIRGVNLNDPAKSGEDIEFFVKVLNPTSGKLYDLQAKAVFIDDGGYVVSPDFSIEKGKKEVVPLVYNTKDKEKGDYIVRVSVKNQDVHDSKYVYARII
jgi:hypothetical protein